MNNEIFPPPTESIINLKSKMYKLRLDGHFYTILDDKIFNEISDQW